MEALANFPKMEYTGAMINTVEALVDEFGGIKPFAAAVGVSLPPVYRAIDLDHLPFKWRMPLYAEAKRRRLRVDPKLFGLEAA